MVRKAVSMDEAGLWQHGVGYPPVREPLLLAFLEEWLDWTATPNCQDTHIFSKRTGLCGSLIRWCAINPLERNRAYLSNSLTQIFSNGGYDKSYPFGEVNFSARIRGYTQHLDPLRLKWVENTIAATKREMNRPTQRITL